MRTNTLPLENKASAKSVMEDNAIIYVVSFRYDLNVKF